MPFEVKFNATSQKISVQLAQNLQTFPLQLKDRDKFQPGFKALQIATNPDVEIYKGNYEATPRPEAQTFETAERYLKEDFVVNKIPYYSTSNIAGGNTVFIGSSIEVY